MRDVILTTRPGPRRESLARRTAWHPALIAGVVVLGNVAESGVHPAAAGRALVVSLLGAVILQIFLSFACRSARVGAVAATMAVAVIAFWIPLTAFGLAVTGNVALALVAVVGILGSALSLASRRWGQAAVASVTLGLNVFSVAFAAVVIAQAFTSPLAAQLPIDLGLRLASAPTARIPRDQRPPDIYMILMDGHPRPDSLMEQTGHDIASFTGPLDDLGFAVSHDAHANYNWTGASLASLLHMGLIEERALKELASGAARAVINDNPAFDLLRGNGYEIVAIGPPYEHAALRTADRFIDAGYLNSFECHLIRRSAVGAAAWAFAPSFIGDMRRAGVVASIRSAVGVASADDSRPQFVFVHLPVPHLPVLWDAAGDPVEDPLGSDCAPQGVQGLQQDERNAAYLETVDQTDRLVLDGVEQIIEASERRPVIILLSDHGAHLGGSDPDHTDPRAWRDEFGILFAALTPGEPDLFLEGGSLASVLPSLFNAYLGTDLELAPDRSFWPDGSLAPEP